MYNKYIEKGDKMETASPLENFNTTREHKFFRTEVNNDLLDLSNFLKTCYDLIAKAELRGTAPLGEDDQYWKESGSLSTVKWREYNVFQFYNEGIHNLFKSVSNMTKEACEYYGVNFDEQQYMVQGWFNINNRHAGKLDWHDHGPAGAPFFHGYYAVNAEPSVTHYKIYNDDRFIKQNENKNNVAILSEMGHPHAMGDWDWDGDRITVAYDVVPMKFLKNINLESNRHKDGSDSETREHGFSDVIQQHWIPLL